MIIVVAIVGYCGCIYKVSSYIFFISRDYFVSICVLVRYNCVVVPWLMSADNEGRLVIEDQRL